MQIDTKIRKSVASLFVLRDQESEAGLATWLARAVAQDDNESFRIFRYEYLVANISQKLAKIRQTDQIDKHDREEAEIILSAASADRSKVQKLAYGSAREAFSAFLKKHHIQSLESSGGAFNPNGERNRSSIDRQGKAIIALSSCERIRRGENYVIQRIEYALTMMNTLKMDYSSESIRDIERSEKLLNDVLIFVSKRLRF